MQRALGGAELAGPTDEWPLDDSHIREIHGFPG
jgi:hypothetical protein